MCIVSCKVLVALVRLQVDPSATTFGGGHIERPRFCRIAATICCTYPEHMSTAAAHIPSVSGPASCKCLHWKVMNSVMLPKAMLALCHLWHCPCTEPCMAMSLLSGPALQRDDHTAHCRANACFFPAFSPSSPEITLLWAWCEPWSYSGHSSCEIYHHNRYRHCGAHGILPMRDLWSRKCSQFEHSTANSENGWERSQNGNLQKWLELKLRPHDNHAVAALDAHQRQAMNWNHQVSLVEYQHLNKTHWLARWESPLVLPVSEDQVRMARQLVASHGGPSACKTQISPHEPWTWKSPQTSRKGKNTVLSACMLPFFQTYISIFVQNIPIYIVWKRL